MKSLDEQRRGLLHAARLRAIDALLNSGKHNLLLREEIVQATSEQAIADVLAKAGVIVAPAGNVVTDA
jgi:hypothetical protein